MSTNGGGIYIDPNGNTAVVTITNSAGGLFSLFTDSFLTSSVLNPATIAVPTTFYVPQPGGAATISAKVNGVEYAARKNSTLPYIFNSGAVAGLQAPSESDYSSAFAPRLSTPVSSTTFWRGDATFAAPPSGGAKTLVVPHTFDISGPIVAATLPGWNAPVPAGTTATIQRALCKLSTGTVTANIRLAGVSVGGLGALSVTTVDTNTAATSNNTPTDQQIIDVVLTNPAGGAADLKITIDVAYAF